MRRLDETRLEEILLGCTDAKHVNYLRRAINAAAGDDRT